MRWGSPAAGSCRWSSCTFRPRNSSCGCARRSRPTTFWAGLVKAPVFALLIGMVGAYRGMQVRDSARELGRLTTMAVVQSIFLVILADALFAVLFEQIDF